MEKDKLTFGSAELSTQKHKDNGVSMKMVMKNHSNKDIIRLDVRYPNGVWETTRYE